MSNGNPYVIAGGSNEVMHVLHPRLRYPDLWRSCNMAVCPALGPTGLMLRDNSGLGKHCTLRNMDPATDWVISDGKYALDFNGADAYVEVPSISLGTIFSISFWHKARTTGGAGFGRMLASSGDFPTHVTVNGSLTSMSFSVGGTAQTATVQNMTTMQHVAVVFVSGVTKEIWINGSLIAATSHTAGATNSVIYLGNRVSDAARGYDGVMDDIRFYAGRRLIETDIRLLSSRRGIPYEAAQRRSYKSAAAAAFRPAWASQRTQMIGGGNR